MVGVVVGSDDDQINAVVAHDPPAVGGDVAPTDGVAQPDGTGLDLVAEAHQLQPQVLGLHGVTTAHAATPDHCRFHACHSLLLCPDPDRIRDYYASRKKLPAMWRVPPKPLPSSSM